MFFLGGAGEDTRHMGKTTLKSSKDTLKPIWSTRGHWPGVALFRASPLLPSAPPFPPPRRPFLEASPAPRPSLEASLPDQSPVSGPYPGVPEVPLSLTVEFYSGGSPASAPSGMGRRSTRRGNGTGPCADWQGPCRWQRRGRDERLSGSLVGSRATLKMPSA